MKMLCSTISPKFLHLDLFFVLVFWISVIIPGVPKKVEKFNS